MWKHLRTPLCITFAFLLCLGATGAPGAAEKSPEIVVYAYDAFTGKGSLAELVVAHRSSIGSADHALAGVENRGY